MFETNKLCFTLIMSGFFVLVTYNYYSIQKENSLFKNENNQLNNKNINLNIELDKLEKINFLLENTIIELKQQNNDVIKKNNELVNENINLKNINENYSNKINELIEENNNNIIKINNKEDDKILFDEELMNECYDNIPCNNIKKRTTNFLW